MAKHRLTDEERTAKRLAEIVSDVRIDLDLVGIYLVRAFPNVSFRRLQEVVEAAEQEKENKYVREYHNPLF